MGILDKIIPKKEKEVEKPKSSLDLPRKQEKTQTKLPETEKPSFILNNNKSKEENNKSILPLKDDKTSLDEKNKIEKTLNIKKELEKEKGIEKKSKKILEKKLETTNYKPIFQIKKDKKIIQLPEFNESQKEDFEFKYPLIEPYAYAKIKWDAKSHQLIYLVEEPELTKDEQDNLKKIETGMNQIISMSFIKTDREEKVIEYLEKNTIILIKELSLKVPDDSFLKLMYYIYRNFIGLNEIEPLMRDYFIEDIECNGSATPIYLVHRKYRNLKTNEKFNDNQILANFVEKLAQKSGSYVSFSNPTLDAALPDGSRVNATYTQDISSKGPTFTIRKFTKEPWSPVKLMHFGTVSPEILAYFWIAIEYGSNFIVIGGTGSGKTSFLNSVAFFIPPSSRVISIEDTREINLLHENWLPSVAREGVEFTSDGGKKRGEVSLFDLLKESFRQRPDFVIVGEIRGKEAFVLFQGASAGHPTASTMHAESVETMIRRLETEPINLSPALIQSLDLVAIMIQTKTDKGPARRLREINEIIRVNTNGSAETSTPFFREPNTDKFYFKKTSVVFEKIIKKHGVPREKIYNEFRTRTLLLLEMMKRNITGFEEVQNIITEYYHNPQAVLQRLGIGK